jgi:hypothetical protein
MKHKTYSALYQSCIFNKNNLMKVFTENLSYIDIKYHIG